jgi:hypothetical protein
VRAVAAAQPGSLTGTGQAWSVEIPSGPLPGQFTVTREGLRRLRERLSKTPHTVTASLAADRSYVDLSLNPR